MTEVLGYAILNEAEGTPEEQAEFRKLFGPIETQYEDLSYTLNSSRRMASFFEHAGRTIKRNKELAIGVAAGSVLAADTLVILLQR